MVLMPFDLPDYITAWTPADNVVLESAIVGAVRQGGHVSIATAPPGAETPRDRAAIASLAPLVLDAATEGDLVATKIVRSEALELARTVAGAIHNNGLPDRGTPVALAGGVLLGSDLYRSSFLGALRDANIEPGPVQLVPDPAIGTVVLARRLVGH